MAKQFVLAATFLAFLFMASASSYRTTIVINEDTAPERRGEQQRRPSEGCQGRVQAQQLQSCKQYLRSAVGKGPQGYIVLPTRRKEEGGGKQGQQEQQKRQQQQQQQLQQCCQQLRQVEEQCRCEALKQIVREEQQQPTQPSQPGQAQRQEQIRQVQQRASGLPATCGLGTQRCEMSTGVPGRDTGFW